jgi:hypothetical protein
MRRRLKRLWTRLKQLSTMALSREELLMKLGAARDQSRTAWRLVTIEIAADSATFSYRLDRTKLRQTRSREGRYLLRTNLAEEDPAKLWSHYLLLVVVEEAFKNLKSLPCESRGRSRDPAGLSPARGAHRGPRLHCLLGLLPARHAGAAPACDTHSLGSSLMAAFGATWLCASGLPKVGNPPRAAIRGPSRPSTGLDPGQWLQSTLSGKIPRNAARRTTPPSSARPPGEKSAPRL